MPSLGQFYIACVLWLSYKESAILHVVTQSKFKWIIISYELRFSEGQCYYLRRVTTQIFYVWHDQFFFIFWYYISAVTFEFVSYPLINKILINFRKARGMRRPKTARGEWNLETKKLLVFLLQLDFFIK